MGREKNSKGSSRYAGYISVLYIKARKKNN